MPQPLPAVQRQILRAMDVGSIAVGAWLARIVFVVVLLHGLSSGELSYRAAGHFAVAAMIALFAIPAAGAAPLVTPALALIDVALVLAVFKGDVRLS